MAVDLGQRPKTKWTIRDRVRANQRRNTWRIISSRIPISRFSSLWNWYSTGDRQRWEKLIRNWAVSNALTLIFIGVMFVITWIWILVAVTFFGGSLH